MPMYIDIKKDFSLYNRFYEAVKILATETGSLNDRLFKAYWRFLFAIGSSNFQEKELQEKLKYVESIIHNEQKCYYYKRLGGGKLHCQWKESKKMAEYIFQIYDYIIEARYKNDR